jgi:hypothetical protein
MGNNPNRYIFRSVLLQLPATGGMLPSTESAECEDDNNWRKKLNLGELLGAGKLEQVSETLFATSWNIAVMRY